MELSLSASMHELCLGKQQMTASDLSASPCTSEASTSSGAGHHSSSSSSHTRVVHGYRLLQTIGHGSFAKVKVGEHVRTGHLAAVKIINRAKLSDQPEQMRKIERETKLMAKIQHPHVIAFIKNVVTPTDIFLIVELAGGGELFTFITAHGMLGEELSRRFFQQLVSGVKCCHERGIVHRDLKPENILLDNTARNVKIADFGLSSALCDGRLLWTACGSPNYAAPEIVQHRLEFDDGVTRKSAQFSYYAGPEVDIWSLGVILYVMISGQLPFASADMLTLFRQILAGQFAIPPGMPPAVAHLCTRMIDVDPIKRATIDEILHDEWFRQDLLDYLFVDSSKSYQKRDADIPVNMDVICQFALTHNKSLDSVLREVANDLHPDLVLGNELLAGLSLPAPDAELSDEPTTLSQSNIRLIARHGGDRKRARTPTPNCCGGGGGGGGCSDSGSRASTPSAHGPTAPQVIKPSLRVCLPEGSQFCRLDCDLCPAWGAKRCLFVHRVQRLNQCDLCSHYKGKGCMFSLDKITMEDLCRPLETDETSFRIGAQHDARNKEAFRDSVMTSVFSPSVDENILKKMLAKNFMKESWHLGVISNSKPTQIVIAFCKTLKKVQFEWQFTSTYSLRIKPVGRTQPLVDVQLFRLKQNTYLLDFTHDPIAESAMPPPAQLPTVTVTEESSSEQATTVHDLLPSPSNDDDLPPPSSALLYLDSCAKILGKILKG